MSRIKLSREQILADLSAGPKTITDLAGGSRAYSVRHPIREAIDALLAAGQVRVVALGRVRCFVPADWRVTDAWLVEYFGRSMRSEGQHRVWDANWDQWHRAVLRIDGGRYDVRRELYRIRTGKTLGNRDTVRAKCEHEACMAPACQVVHKAKGSKGPKHSVATKAKLAAAKRSRSKYGADLVAQVKASTKSYKQIARETGMKLSTVGAIKGGRLWKDYSSPWAGLLAA